MFGKESDNAPTGCRNFASGKPDARWVVRNTPSVILVSPNKKNFSPNGTEFSPDGIGNNKLSNILKQRLNYD